MESRRLKNKKQELESYQKRVVAYAKRQKNPFYMLGDWLLTLCALGIILVEEIYKFFRHRLNLESFSRFLREDVRWYRVWIHFTLAFLLPVMIFSIGITSQSGSFWSNFYHRLSQGVLFSTTVSLAATLVTDFVENLQPETKSDGRNRSSKRTVYQISVDQATVIGLLLTIVILMVASFLFTQSGSQGINFTGLILQFVLYGGALLLYGSGGRVDAEKLHEKADTEREE